LQKIKNNIDSLAAAMIGGLLVILFTRHGGVGISPDSIYYLSAADSLKAGHGYYQFDDTPFIMFPLFFPTSIACIEFVFHHSYFQLAPYVNALLFGLTIFISGCMLEQTNHSKWLKWIVLLLIALSPSLLEVYSMLWSETWYVLMVLLFIWYIKKYFEISSFRHLIYVAIVAAIAAETRLIGISIIATGGLLIMMNHAMEIQKKLVHFFCFGWIACLPVTINLARNFYLTHTLTGIRQKGVTPFIVNLQYYGEVLISWLPFTKGISAYPVLVACFFLATVTGIFMYRAIRKLEHHTYEKIAVAYTLIYSILMLLTATISRYETINNRLLAPFFIPCLFTISFYSVAALQAFVQKTYRIGWILLVTLSSGMVIWSYVQTDKASWIEYNEGGIGGYTDDDWRINSELINYLRQDHSLFRQGIPVYSNASHAVYFNTKAHLLILPETKHLEAVQKFNKQPLQLLIWFTKEENFDLLSLEQVRAHKSLTVIKSFKDGYIFRCATK